MRIGTFHMELVPDRNIDVSDIFTSTLDKLMEKYGDKLLEINIQQMNQQGDVSRHYG
jgi:hypothetical protein